MPRLIPPVLSSLDLPETELRAAMLDGELFPIGTAFGPVDVMEQPRHRAASLHRTLPPRLIAERRTAAWVHGAIAAPPSPHQLCADRAARYRVAGRRDMTVREVVLADEDTAVVEGLRMTTPLRTLLDIARAPIPEWDDPLVMRELAAIGAITLADCTGAVEARRHLPDKGRTLWRLESALGGQPPLTRYTS